MKTCRGYWRQKSDFYLHGCYTCHTSLVHCRPNQSHSSTYTQAHKMEVKLTAGVVVRIIDKEKREGQWPVQGQARLRRWVNGWRKLNPERRKGSKAVATFQDKLLMPTPFWPRNVLTIMEVSKTGEEWKWEEFYCRRYIYISFLKSMMTDRVASYQGKDLLTTRAENYI